MILVSGWMEEDEDDKRAFGILPDYISHAERLSRFYEIHCPDRLNKMEQELEDFYFHIEDLYDQVSDFLDPTICLLSISLMRETL